MSVKIFTEGGKNIGLGHISRCYALYYEIARRNVTVQFFVFGELKNYKLIDGLNLINEDWLSLEFVREHVTSDDYVIIDSYKALKVIYEEISRRSKKAIFIDDTGRLDYPKGIIVNPSLDSISIDYSKSYGYTLLTGPRYIILREYFRNLKRTNVSKKLTKVMITMGGSDIRNLLPKIIGNICRNMPEIQFDVVASFYDLNKIEIQSFNLENVTYYSDVNAKEMAGIIMSSDLVITAAGQTIYELLATKTPFVPIQVVDNQKNNLRALSKINPKQIVLHFNDKDLIDKLHDSIQLFSQVEYRQRHASIYKDLIDGHGAKRIIDFLLRDEQEDQFLLRHVKPTDMMEVFDLSNQEYVRKYSINPNEIDWNHHIEWFNQTIQDENTLFYVVTDQNESFLGQVRFQIKSKNATISVSLSEKIKGRGLSKRILMKSIIKMFEEKPVLDTVLAFVHVDNNVSKKIFERLGFSRLDTVNSLIKYGLHKDDFYDK